MRVAVYRRLGVGDPVARQGFEICRQATRKTGEIEYAVTRLLPPELRIAIWSLYGAARAIDDLAESDSICGDSAPNLAGWVRAFERDLERGGSKDPVRAALLHTVRAWHLPPSYLRTVFEGQRADAAGREFATWEDWYEYVTLVNAPFVIQIASMFLQDAGLSVSLQREVSALDVWQNLARALNLTDALADIGEDGRRNQVRLPAQALQPFGLSPDDLREGRKHPAMTALIHHLTDTARAWFDNFPQLPAVLHPAMGAVLTCYIDLHRLLLDAVDRCADDLPPGRITIRPNEARRLLLPAHATTALAWAVFPSPFQASPIPARLPAAAPARVPSPRQPIQPPSPPPVSDPRMSDRHVERTAPRHVAIIMDGNGRWAAARRLSRSDGHRAGMRALKNVVDEALEMGLPYLTVYAFSTENWKRPTAEVNTLMHLLSRDMLRENTPTWRSQGVRVRWSGERAGLPLDMVSILTSMAEQTRHNTRLTLTLCVNYGGRAELSAAAGRLAADAVAGRMHPRAVTEPQFAACLNLPDLPDLPDVDLLLRTGGEQRISNFLPWQTAYAELMFVDTPWPQFDRQSLREAINAYSQRIRRFGATDANRFPQTPD